MAVTFNFSLPSGLVSARLMGLLVFTWVACSMDFALAMDDGISADPIGQTRPDLVNADLASSERRLNQLLSDVEAEQGDYAKALIDPLINLARIYADTGRRDKAYENLRRAQHLMHRQDGVYALEQLEIIDLLFELEINGGEFLQAESQQEFALFIQERNTGKDSPELLPALLKMARWQFETGQYAGSRQTLDRALEIITAHFSHKDPRMVEVLVLQARTRQLEGTCCAERLLEQARAILAENPRQNDEFPPVLFALADAYTAKRKPELAAEYYQQAVAYQALQAEGMSTTAELEPKLIPTQGQLNRFNPHTKVYVPKRNTMNPYYYHHSFPDKERFEEQLQREIFIIPFDDHQYNVRIGSGQQPQTGAEPITRLIGEPIQFELNHLEEVLPGSYLRDAKLTEVSLKLQFSVMADGSVSGLEVISSNAPNKLAQLVKRAISLSKFRPRLVNGIATDTHQVEIMQTFPPINDIIQQ